MAGKVTEALSIAANVQAGAALPQVVQAAISVARKLQCQVTFTWEKHPVVVGPDDTYQGVQRRVQRARGGK